MFGFPKLQNYRNGNYLKFFDILCFNGLYYLILWNHCLLNFSQINLVAEYFKNTSEKRFCLTFSGAEK